MSKDIDDLIKSLPPEKRAVYDKAQSQVQGLKAQEQSFAQDTTPAHIPNQNATQRDAPGESAVFKHDNKSMQNAYDQQSAAPQGNSQEVDKMISDRSKAQTIDTGKELNQHQVKDASKDQDQER